MHSIFDLIFTYCVTDTKKFSNLSLHSNKLDGIILVNLKTQNVFVETVFYFTKFKYNCSTYTRKKEAIIFFVFLRFTTILIWCINREIVHLM
jgi:hypothetical protein